MHAETPAGQALFDSAKRKGIVPPDAVWSAAERPSWVILALSFVGAQFAIWPFLGFLAMFVKEGVQNTAPVVCDRPRMA